MKHLRPVLVIALCLAICGCSRGDQSPVAPSGEPELTQRNPAADEIQAGATQVHLWGLWLETAGKQPGPVSCMR